MINNSGLKFSHINSNNQSKSDEIKPFSFAESLSGNHDFSTSDSSSNSTKTFTSAAVLNSPTAQIDVNYYGFSEEAKNSFEYAVTIWEGLIKSDVAIEVDAYWQDLSQYGSGILGAASPYSFKRNFDGATKDNTYYAMSLANHLAGKDLNGGSAEIETWFNSKFSNWYFGTDGNAPKGKYDFTTVVLHELGHGFGLTDFIDYNSGKGSYGNTIFESFIVNSDNQSLSSFPNNSKDLGKQLTSNDLFFNGANAVEANNGEKIKLYAPNKWEYGSSVAHLDEKTYPKGDTDALMTPYLKGGEVIHNPGALTLGILEDLGWDINSVDTVPATPKETPTNQSKETPQTPTLPADVINFEEDKITSYAGQDKKSDLTISNNKQELKIAGNGWKKLAFDYQVTENTILEFKFKSDIIGEIQGIGFDTDDKLSNSDKKLVFQLGGTDKLGIRNFTNLITEQTDKKWTSYKIKVGEHFTGDFNYLTFINDHDKGNKNAESQYLNLTLYEEGQQVSPVETPPETPETTTEVPTNQSEETPTTPPADIINFEEDKITSYAGQDKKSELTISDKNQQLKIAGNGWKKLAFDYQVTENTILEFKFKSDIIGEIQGIGFDTDDKLSNSDKKRVFQLGGTDKLGIRNFTNLITEQTDKNWTTYKIKVGEHFTGDFNYLTFINDHDKGNKNAESQYLDLILYEEGQQVSPVETPINPPEETPINSPADIINFEEDKITSYAGQDKKSDLTISDNSQGIKIEGNSWKKLAFDYQITENTILEFQFKSDIIGEIQGIGFDTDDKLSNSDKKRVFQLEGTDKLGIRNFTNHSTEKPDEKGLKTYQITVGDYFTGDFNYLTFINDHDKGAKNAASQYHNIKIYEANKNQFSKTETEENLNSDVVLTVNDSTNNSTLSSYGGITQDQGILNISNDKTKVEITGNSWKKLDINNYNVTKNTVLKFDFQSETEAEIQGIGFDNDDIISGGDEKNLFQIAGTQDWGIELEDNYTLGSGWQTYEIKVGEHISGEFNYLTLANDHDVSNSTAQSQFRNISLSEM